MKRYLVLAILVFVGAAVAEAPSIGLDYRVTPSSVNPGGMAQVIIDVQNLDPVTDVEDLEIKLIGRGGGVSVTSARADLGTLSASSSSSAAFAVRALERASPGTYILEASGSYRYDDPGDGVERSGSFGLNIPVVISYRSSLEIFARDTQITPGARETLLITLNNAGKSTIRNLIVGLSPDNNAVYPIGSIRKSIDSIEAGEAGEATFDVRASDTASVGIQPITITVTYTDAGGATQTETESIAVTVVDPGTEVVVDSIESDLEPGKTGSVKVGIKNIGEVNLVNLYLSMMAGEGLGISGSNEKMIESLAVGETKTVEFEFDVDSEAEARPVESSLHITYQREGGKVETTEAKTLGVVVTGEVELRVVDVDTDVEDGEIEVDIANYGNKDAEAVKIQMLQGGEEFGTGFTDNIKPNKHKVFRFDLPTQTDIVVRFSYKDYDSPEGMATGEESIRLEQNQITKPAPDMTGGIVVLVLAVLAAVWYLRKRGKEKREIDISKYK